MIPKRYITEWRKNSPWPEESQVEQDLVIERAIVQIFSDPFLKENLAFRGGTALHKLFLKPQVRYSEDIDLVQIKEGPIKPILVAIRKQLAFLGTKRKVKQNVNMNTVTYRFESEIPPIINLRLKIEINCREHFTVFGFQEAGHKVENGWYSGECKIKTYKLEELLGTKLRALYQRSKGRDLFDLFYALKNTDAEPKNIILPFKEYINYSVNKIPSKKEILKNLDLKMQDPDFTGDIYALLRPDTEYDVNDAYELIKNEIIDEI